MKKTLLFSKLSKDLISISLVSCAIFCLPCTTTAAKWQRPRPSLCDFILTAVHGMSEQKSLLQSAGFSFDKYVNDKPLVNNIAAAFGLQFVPGYDGKKYSHAYRLQPNYGVQNFGSSDYWPLSTGYFVPISTIQFIEKILNSDLIHSDFLPAKESVDAFLDMLNTDENHKIITERLRELNERSYVSIAGINYVWIGPQDNYKKEVPVRLATSSDWTKAPSTHINVITSQEILSDVTGGYKNESQFGNMMSAPLQYDGNRGIVYSRNIPTIEGSEIYIIIGDRAIRGIYRGHWEPGSIRGWPLREVLKNTRSLHKNNRFFFVEISNSNSKEVVAINSHPDIKILTTDR